MAAPKPHFESASEQEAAEPVVEKAAPATPHKAKAPTVTFAEPEADPEEQPSPEPSAPDGQPAGTSGPMRQASTWLSRTFPGHEHAVLGGVCGLLAAMLVFLVGFWRTLFVSLVVLVGVTLGQVLDGDPKIINFIRRVLAEGRNNEQ